MEGLPAELWTRILCEAIRMPPVDVTWNSIIIAEFLQGFKLLPALNPRLPAGVNPSLFQRRIIERIWQQVVENPQPGLLIESRTRHGLTTGIHFAVLRLLELVSERTFIAIIFENPRQKFLFQRDHQYNNDQRVRMYARSELNALRATYEEISIYDLEELCVVPKPRSLVNIYCYRRYIDRGAHGMRDDISPFAHLFPNVLNIFNKD